MVSIQFAVAKFVPDLHRLEPRNIGVVLWAADAVPIAKFLGEIEDRVKPPAMVTPDSREAYRQWITYWRYQLLAPSIRRDNGEVVLRDSPKFLEALREKSKEQFRLVDGGFLTERIGTAELPSVLDDLFSKLVEKQPSPKVLGEAAELSTAYTRILSDTGIVKRTDYHPDLPIPRKVHGVVRPFVADAALGAVGRPVAVFQKVLLTKRQSVDSSVLMIDTLINAERNPISKQNFAVLIDSQHATDNESKSGLRLLRKIANVIDVAGDDAPGKIAEISARTAA